MGSVPRRAAIAVLAALPLSGCWLLDSRPRPRGDAGTPRSGADSAPIAPDASTLDARIGSPDAEPRDSGAALDAGSRHSGDAGPSCRFVAAGIWGGPVIECAIALDSSSACTEAAVCLCGAAEITDEAELLQCVGAELTPRGAITFADYCTESPPARHTFAEALAGFFAGRGAGELPISDECDDVPALIGNEPWELCAQLAGRVCRCSDADCRLEAIVGARCLSLARETVGCLLGRLPDTEEGLCASLDGIPALRRECGE